MRLACYTLLLFFTSLSFGAGDLPATTTKTDTPISSFVSNPNCNINAAKEAAIAKGAKEAKEEASAEDKELWRAAVEHEQLILCGKQQDSTCKDAADKFTDASKAFKSACDKAGISDPEPQSSFACAKSLRACGECARDSSAARDSDDDDEDEPRSSNKKGKDPLKLTCSDFNVGGYKGIDQSLKKISYCPLKAGENLDKFETDVKKLQEEIEKQRQELPKKQQEINKIESDAKEKKRQSDDAITKAKREFDQATLAEEEKASEGVKAKLQELRRKQDEYYAAVDKMRETEHARDEAYVTSYQNKVSDFESACYTSALKTAAAEQTRIAGLMAQGKWTAGDLTSVFGFAGRTDRTRYKIIAHQMYLECMNSGEHKRLVKNATAAYNLVRNRAGSELSKGERQKLLITSDQNQITQVDIPQLKTAAERRLAKMRENHEEFVANEKRRQDELDLDAQNAKFTAQQDLNRLSSDIGTKQQDLNKKMALLKARQKATGDRDISKEDVGKISSSQADAASTASKLLAARENDVACCKKGSKYSDTCRFAIRVSEAFGEAVDPKLKKALKADADSTPAGTSADSDGSDTDPTGTSDGKGHGK